MKRTFLAMVALLVAASVVIAGCSQAAPAPTAAPAKPAASSGSSAAPAAAAYPEKGKNLQIIVPFSAGGSTDVQTRLVAGAMEKDLGIPVEVVDKPGAGSQVGLTALAQAKPDGYTIGTTNNATTMGVYMMPDRKATFDMSSFAPIGMFIFDPECITVSANGPYKTYKDFIDAAKAKPKTIKTTTNGMFSDDHMAIAKVQQETGAQFAIVHFDGSADEVTALLGGKTDAAFMGVGASLANVKSGQMRVLAIMDEKPNSFMPDVPTLTSLGINFVWGSTRGLSAPAGTPKEAIDRLSASLAKAMQDPDVSKKVTDMGNTIRVMNAADYAKWWADQEKVVRPIVDAMLKDQGVLAPTAVPTK